jgi:hypothetical protein
MSRLWGYINSLELPVWLRPYGLRLYASAFGCNLEEIEPDDLTQYVSLGDFFYRKLKEGVRPVANAALVSIIPVPVLIKGLVFAYQALPVTKKFSRVAPWYFFIDLDPPVTICVARPSIFVIIIF